MVLGGAAEVTGEPWQWVEDSGTCQEATRRRGRKSELRAEAEAKRSQRSQVLRRK